MQQFQTESFRRGIQHQITAADDQGHARKPLQARDFPEQDQPAEHGDDRLVGIDRAENGKFAVFQRHNQKPVAKRAANAGQDRKQPELPAESRPVIAAGHDQGDDAQPEISEEIHPEGRHAAACQLFLEHIGKRIRQNPGRH